MSIDTRRRRLKPRLAPTDAKKVFSVFRRSRESNDQAIPSAGRHAEALAAAIEALGAGTDTQATLRALARASCAALSADRAMVWLVDAAVGLARRVGEAHQRAADSGLPIDERFPPAEPLEMRLDDPLTVELFSAGTIQMAHDGDPLARHFQAHSLIAVPFLRGHAVAGVVIATCDANHRDWSANDLTTLSALAVQAGLAVERATMAAETQRLVLEDPLTGLPNRTLFLDRLKQALSAANQTGTPLAVCVVNLDDFKDINDALGHAAGDAVLCAVAARLRGALRVHETVARLGGDEFGVLLPANQAAAEVVADRLAGAFTTPVVVAERQVSITARLGIAVYPDHGHSAEALLRRADLAMTTARRAQVVFAVASAGEDTPSNERFMLIAGLRQALNGEISEGGYFELHYQPKVACASGVPQGAEALVRWHHPTLGMISPARFIPLAEETGLIHGLTRWALQEAVRQCQVWLTTGWPLTVAVNLAAQDIQDTALPGLIAGLLEQCGLPPQHLTVEVTESMLVKDPERAMGVLTELQTMGVRASLDDFGTGFSSLSYLKRLPLYELKIDQSFVRDLVNDERDRAIVASTISLGHSFGLRIVAEGVEDQATLDLLRTLGTDIAQGYHLCRPLPAAAFGKWMAARLAPLS